MNFITIHSSSINRYNGNFNIIEDPFGKICVNLESISHDQRDK